MTEYRVLHHNTAGGMNCKGGPEALDPINRQIASWSPDVVTLNEVCQTQAELFGDQHPGWSVFYDVRRLNSDCAPGGGNIGNLLASPYLITNVAVQEMGMVRTGAFNILSASVHKPGQSSVRSAVVHLPPEGMDPNEVERRRMVNLIAAEALRHDKFTVSGDFNATPQQTLMKPLYDVAIECDQGPDGQPPARERIGEKTWGEQVTKIDYVFMRRINPFTHSGGTVEGAPSDHEILRARFTW
jgi:endonuclease/exonuclease/phosphatase family metal-dependent hydrolase